jgi:hypothetical protein
MKGVVQIAKPATQESVIFDQKESYHVLDHFVRDSRWMTVGWPLDRSIFTSYPYELVLLH